MRRWAPGVRLFVVLVLGSLILGRAPAGATQEAAADILRIQWGEFPETLDPQQTDVGQYQLTGLAFEGLTRLDDELNTVPAAAESWEFSDDGLTLTFRLRDHLVYNDGTPLTAERFRYAVERECDPHNDFFDVASLFVIVGCEALNTSLEDAESTPASGEAAYEAAKGNLGVQTLDDRTLEIRLTQPAPYFPSVAGGAGFLPVKQELVEAGGPEWWLDSANWVGNGPFQVVGIEKDASTPRITLARNEHYWGGPAKLDGIEYLLMDAESAFEAYIRGELDVIHPAGEQIPEIETDPVLSQELLTMPATFTGVFLLNLTQEPFTDKRVREAFAYAFDRSAYCREVESGFCTPTLSWIPQGVPGSIATNAYTFDPDMARQALAASSYGGPESLPEIRWYVDEGDTWEVRQADWLADQFRQVLGVELVLTPVEDEAFDAMFTDSATWPQMASTFWYSSLPDPHEWMEFWTCGSEYFAVYIGYCNPDYDALVDQSNRELDPEKRLALAEASQRTLVADAPSIFVYNPTNWWLVKPAVTGYSRVAPQQQWPGWWNPLAVEVVRTA